MAASETVSQVLLSELIFDKKELISLDKNQSVDDALAVLSKNDIISAPVWDDEKKVFIGMLDVWDIMLYTAFGNYFENGKDDEFSEISSAKYHSTKVRDLVQCSENSRVLWIYEPTDKLVDLLEPFSKGVHRVLVRQKDDFTSANLYRVLSQSDVVSFLFKRLDKVSIADKRVEELGLVDCKRKVVTVSEKSSALRAYRDMYLQEVTSIAIVSDEGKIVANFSPSDLRGFNSKKLKNLLLPVVAFLDSQSLKRKHYHPVTCFPTSSLREVITKTVTSRCHRVWVVDATERPIGLISLTDIITKFSPFDYK